MSSFQTLQLLPAPLPSSVPPCGCCRETREQLATPRYRIWSGREPQRPPKSKQGSGPQAWGLSGTGPSMLRSEAIALPERQREAVWQQLCGPRLCTNIQTHTSHPVLSQWLGSFPTPGAKEGQVNTYGGQKHTKPPLPETHTASHIAMVCLSQTLGCIWYKQISLL